MIERIFMPNWLDNQPAITLILVTVILFLINYYFKLEKCGNTIPSPKCSRLAVCYVFIKKLSWRLKSDYVLSELLNSICGLCQLFDRERIFRLHILTKPLVVIFKPETAEAILSSSTHIEKASDYKFLKPWLGTGLISSGGKKWRYRRKLLTPTFHFRILDDFLPIFNEQSNILVSKLRKQASSNCIDIVPLVTSCALDIISETAMGVKINAQGEGCMEYVNAIHEIMNSFLITFIRPWLYYDFILKRTSTGKKIKESLKILHGFTRQVIRKRKEEFSKQEQMNKNETGDSGTKKKTAFLELLLKFHFNDPSFTEEDIREEVDTFMFAGHDTTAMTTSFALWLVGLDENVQRLVHEELDEIFMGDTDREITREDLSQMKYLECVIKETLRLYPVVPIIGRELHDSFKICQYTIERGTYCLIFPFALHRDPKSFPNPEKFDPERFFPENVAKRHPYAYVPFSAGPRNCIGQKYGLMEAKTVLANIFRNFTVKSKDPRDRVRVLPYVVLNNIDPLRLYLKSRK